MNSIDVCLNCTDVFVFFVAPVEFCLFILYVFCCQGRQPAGRPIV